MRTATQSRFPAWPPGRHQEQAPKQRCTFRPTTFCSVQFSFACLVCASFLALFGTAFFHKDVLWDATTQDAAAVAAVRRATTTGTCTTNRATHTLADGSYNPACCGLPRTWCDDCACGQDKCCGKTFVAGIRNDAQAALQESSPPAGEGSFERVEYQRPHGLHGFDAHSAAQGQHPLHHAHVAFRVLGPMQCLWHQTKLPLTGQTHTYVW